VRKGFLGLVVILTTLLVTTSCGDPASQSTETSVSLSPTASPSASMTTYQPGEDVALANGLTVVVPGGLSASMISANPGGPAELFWLVDVITGEIPVSVRGLSAEDLRDDDEPVLQYKLVSASADRTVEVRWVTGEDEQGRRFSHVAIVTRLPGKLVGTVIPLPAYGRDRALTRADALQQAAEVWRLLSVGGAELPGETS